MFFPQELDSYLEWNGFSIIHKYGGFEEEVFNGDSENRCLFVNVSLDIDVLLTGKSLYLV